MRFFFFPLPFLCTKREGQVLLKPATLQELLRIRLNDATRVAEDGLLPEALYGHL